MNDNFLYKKIVLIVLSPCRIGIKTWQFESWFTWEMNGWWVMEKKFFSLFLSIHCGTSEFCQMWFKGKMKCKNCSWNSSFLFLRTRVRRVRYFISATQMVYDLFMIHAYQRCGRIYLTILGFLAYYWFY